MTLGQPLNILLDRVGNVLRHSLIFAIPLFFFVYPQLLAIVRDQKAGKIEMRRISRHVAGPPWLEGQT